MPEPPPTPLKIASPGGLSPCHVLEASALEHKTTVGKGAEGCQSLALLKTPSAAHREVPSPFIMSPGSACPFYRRNTCIKQIHSPSLSPHFINKIQTTPSNLLVQWLTAARQIYCLTDLHLMLHQTVAQATILKYLFLTPNLGCF